MIDETAVLVALVLRVCFVTARHGESYGKLTHVSLDIVFGWLLAYWMEPLQSGLLREKKMLGMPEAINVRRVR